MAAGSVTSTIDNFNADRYANIEIPFPDLDEQRRIADFLDDQVSRIDNVIAARQRQVALTESIGRSSLQWDLDVLGVRYGWVRLRHAIRGMEQGWSPQADAYPAPEDSWGVMRAGCVNGGHFDAEDNKVLPDGIDPRTEYEVRPGDLLMSRASGSIELIGSVAVVPSDVRPRLLLCDKLYRIDVRPRWDREFVAFALRGQHNRERIRLGVSGAEGMANNLPSGVIRDLLLPNAPRPVQSGAARRFAELNADSQHGRDALARFIDLLAEYKQSLITAAVTGELDVTTVSALALPA